MIRFLVILLIIAALLFGAWLAEGINFKSPGPAKAETVVLIKAGRGVSAIAATLKNAGAIASPELFFVGVRLRNLQGQLKAGEYAIPAHASMQDIIAILVKGRSIEHKLTVAEGLTSQMAYDLVKADKVLTGAAGAVPAEGTLLPETYLFTRGTTRAELLSRMRTAQKKLLAKLWPARAKDLPFKTADEAVVMASVVEKETALPNERPHIASVFNNRLRIGMKLQSDPTIIYGITRGYPLGRGIRASEIAANTPYNTYVIVGLPRTPIANPGRDSIAAVLKPANTNDLYFVANGTGGHVFAATVADHNTNVAKWRVIERQPKPAPATTAPAKSAEPAIRKSSTR